MATKQYPIVARFTKRFTSGLFQGHALSESLGFVSVKDAEQWLVNINAAKTLNYVIEDFQFENPIHTKK